jgi:hypothetical protein
MAALAVAMRNAYIRLGLVGAAATFITEDQAIDNLDELRLLKDDEIETLCKVICRPGGTIVNPGAVAGQPAVISNPGNQVPLRAEKNLKLASYWLRHSVRVSRPRAVADLTLENVRSIIELKDTEEANKPPEAPTISSKDWPRTMESILDYFRSYLGETGIPLAYVIRKDIAVKPSIEDNELNYHTKQEEMIARAPIVDENGNFTLVYIADRTKVWELIATMCREQECWTYVKPAQRQRDGRKAYWDLFNHYLGRNNVGVMANAAENKLQNTSYNGEKKRWTFERYVRTHVEQHTILEGLREHGYSGIDESSKVRLFINGIKSKALDSVTTRIMSDEGLIANFDQCANLYKDFLQRDSDRNTPSISQISEVKSSSKDNRSSQGKQSHGKGSSNKRSDGNSKKRNGNVEDRYYSHGEYMKLTSDQKAELAKLRDDRDPDRKKKRKHEGNGGKTIKDMSRTIASLAATIAKNNGVEGDEESVSTAEEGSNRNHPALTRQKKKKN